MDSRLVHVSAMPIAPGVRACVGGRASTRIEAPRSPQDSGKSDRQVVALCSQCVASCSSQTLGERGLLTDLSQQLSGEFRIACDNLTHAGEYDDRKQKQKRHLGLLGFTLHWLLLTTILTIVFSPARATISR
jgi:hypothetical protein